MGREEFTTANNFTRGDLFPIQTSCNCYRVRSEIVPASQYGIMEYSINTHEHEVLTQVIGFLYE